MRLPTPHQILWLLFSFILIASCSGGAKIKISDQIHENLASGDFQKALDHCQNEYWKNQKKKETAELYIETIEYIKTHGDKAFQKGDFVSAGTTYALLLKNFHRFNVFSDRLSFDRKYLISRLRMSQVLIMERQVTSCDRVVYIQKGIEQYKELHQQDPQDQIIRRDYVALLELIRSQADGAYEKNNLLLAGCIYRTLWNNFNSFNSVRSSLSYNRELLNTNLKKCQKKLFEDGLEQYRRGDLSMAISIWRSILTFDPENQEVKRTLNIAIQQSRTLEKVKQN